MLAIMPPVGFRNITVPDEVYAELLRVRADLIQRGTQTLPREAIPSRFHDAHMVTIGMVIAIGLHMIQGVDRPSRPQARERVSAPRKARKRSA
jgi:hypothetical protein